jgi:hypothetical protein
VDDDPLKGALIEDMVDVVNAGGGGVMVKEVHRLTIGGTVEDNNSSKLVGDVVERS